MDTVLNIKNLKTFFFTHEGVAKAVNGVNLRIAQGEILGVVGESGCGKSVMSLSILRLVPHPGRIMEGSILLGEKELLTQSERRMRQIRGNRISMIFQEPMISLNPAFTVGDQLIEALRTHQHMSKGEARDRTVEMLRKVEIPAPERRVNEYPHQLSGGMRQRAMIAEALMLKPEVLLADEPTTALDVTIQAQVLDIMCRLTQESGTSIILITHNLGLVAESARRVVVMYAGKVVEEGPVESIFEDARHPYTRGLLQSIPLPGQRRDKRHRRLHEIEGIVPNLFDLPGGCSFHPRCCVKKNVCSHEQPPWSPIAQGHWAACWCLA